MTRWRITAAAAVALLAASCSVDSAPAGGSGGDELRVRIGADISILDPAKIFQIENQTVAANVYDGLVKYDQKTNDLVPDLAEKWTISPDAKTYTFTLRSGVRWQKGYGDFTADDVRFSIERVLDPATGSPYAGQYADVASVDAVDAHTVRIGLKRSNAGFLNKVAAFNQGWIVSRKAVTKLGADYTLHPVGTGPFVFDRWSPGTSVELSANKDYFGGAPKVKRVTFRVIKDENAAAVALRDGEIDVLFALQSPTVISQLEKANGVTVRSRPASSTLNLVMNMRKSPLDKLQVRQAIAYGINRPALVKDFFKGRKDEATSVFTPTFLDYTDDVPRYAYDPDRARHLVEAAGATGAEIDLVSVGLSPYDQIVVPLSDDLKKIGLRPKITVLERAAYQQARSKGDIMTAVTSVVGPPDPDALLTTLFSSASFPPGLNTARYRGVDDLLARARTQSDPTARQETYHKVLDRTMTDLPVLPLYSDRLYLAASDAVTGLVQNSLFTVQLDSVSLRG